MLKLFTSVFTYSSSNCGVAPARKDSVIGDSLGKEIFFLLDIYCGEYFSSALKQM